MFTRADWRTGVPAHTAGKVFFVDYINLLLGFGLTAIIVRLWVAPVKIECAICVNDGASAGRVL